MSKNRKFARNHSEEKVESQQTEKGSRPDFNKRKGPKAKGRNPIEIWNHNPGLTKLSCSIPFSQGLGQPVQWDMGGGITASPAYQKTTPGLMKLETLLTYGTANDESSSLNVASRNIWTFLRSVNSGAKNYNDSGLMLYFIAIDQAFSFYGWLLRIYGTITQYRVLNRYTPQTILSAQNVNYADIFGKMAQFKYYLDEWATRLQSFVVPLNLTIFKRHFELFTNYFLDSDNLQKAQVYFYSPAKFFKWVEGSAAPSGAELMTAIDFRTRWQNTATTGNYFSGSTRPTFTLADLQLAMDSMLSGIATSEDFNVMAGDLLKAYGSNGVWTIPIVDQYYQSTPVFNWERLCQIHNATLFNNIHLASTTSSATDSVAGCEISKNLGRVREVVNGTMSYLVQDLGMFTTDRAGAAATVIDLPIQDPTPEDVMEATRQMVSGSKLYLCDNLTYNAGSQTKMHFVRPTFVGTEIILKAEMVSRAYNYDATTGDYSSVNNVFTPYQTLPMSGTQNYEGTPFTLMPVFYSSSTAETTVDTTTQTIDGVDMKEYTAIGIQGPYGSLDNFTLLGIDALSRIHRAAVLSVFGIPMNAFTSSSK